MARPERLARIAPKRFWGLRPVVAPLLRPKTLSRFVEQELSSSSEELLMQKRVPLGPSFALAARPERFELPTTWFEVRSPVVNLLFSKEYREGARCMKFTTVHNPAQPKHAIIPHNSI